MEAFETLSVDTFYQVFGSSRPNFFPGEAVAIKKMDEFTLLIPKYQSEGMEIFQAVTTPFEQILEERAEVADHSPRLVAIRHQNFSLKVPSARKQTANYGMQQLPEETFVFKDGNKINTERMQACIEAQLCRLDIKAISMDSCIRKCEIEFKMDLGNGLYVTVMTDKDMYEEGVVEFTVAVDGNYCLSVRCPLTVYAIRLQKYRMTSHRYDISAHSHPYTLLVENYRY